MSAGHDPLRRVASYLPRWVAEAPASRPYATERLSVVLWLDIVGFTALTERLSAESRAGAEHLTEHLNRNFGRISHSLARHGGDLASFAGDAVLAIWRCDDAGQLAEAVALAQACAKELLGPEAHAESGQHLPIKAVLGVGALKYSLIGGHRGRWLPLVQGDVLVELAPAAERLGPGELAVTAGARALLDGAADETPPLPGTVAMSKGDWEAAITMLPDIVQAHIHSGQEGWLGELRPLTVVFIRLPNLPLGLEAHPLVRSLQASIDRLDGSLDKLSLDDKGISALVAVGLPPRTMPDAGVTAIRLAQTLQDDLRRQNVKGGIGIATGRAYCGEVGGADRLEYTVLGDVVNLAARLMVKADEGILLDEPTARQAGGRLVLQPLHPLILKGKAAPVAVYEPRQWRGRSRTRLADIVGRDDLIRSLVSSLSEPPVTPCRALLLEGEPGMGKTSVLDGLCEAMEHASSRILHLVGRAARSGTHLQPWREVFLQLSVVPPEMASNRDQRLLEELLTPDGLLQASGGPADAEDWSRNVADALVRLLGPHPILLVIDDAHLMDSASDQVAGMLVRRHPSARVLMAAVPGHGWQDTPWADLMPNTTGLPHLSEESAAALIHRRIGRHQPSREVTDRIMKLAAGHPLFLEELADAWLESEAETGQQGTVALPATIQGALIRRLDPLPIAEQTLVKILSLVGADAEVGLISTLHPAYPTPESVVQGLEHLAARHLLESGDMATDSSWTFRSSLLRDAVKDQLLEAQQVRVHRLTAEWLERTYGSGPSTASARLAYHHELARQPVPALHHMDHAAVWAMTHFSTAEAEQWCRRALRYEAEQDIMAAKHLRLARHEILGRVFKGRGDLPEAKEHLDLALALGDQLGDHESRAHILSSLAMVAELSGDYPAAKAAYEEASALAGSLGSGWACLRSSLYLSRLHFRNGDVNEALATCRQTLEKEAIWGHLAESASFHAWMMTLVLMTQSRGDAIREAIGKLEEQLAGLRAREEWGNLFNVLGFLGNAYSLIGLYDQSRVYFTDSLKVATGNLIRPNEAAARLNLALQAHALDDHDEMRRQALQARVIAEEGGYKPIQALALRLEALAAALQGKPDQADRLLQAADIIWESLPQATKAAFVVPDQTYQAWVAQALGRSESCLALVETARGALPAVGDREYGLPLALLHAEVLVGLDRAGEALQPVREALSLATELGHASGIEQATRLLASLEEHLNDS